MASSHDLPPLRQPHYPPPMWSILNKYINFKEDSLRQNKYIHVQIYKKHKNKYIFVHFSISFKTCDIFNLPLQFDTAMLSMT